MLPVRDRRPGAAWGRSTQCFGPGARCVLGTLGVATALAAGPLACRAESPPQGRRPNTVNTDSPGPDSLRFELVVPAEVREGAAVPIVLRLTNTREEPLELHLLGRTIAFDITVARADGRLVWRRLEGAAIHVILQIKLLAPGETLELRDVWRQRDSAGRPVGPGTYNVQGALPTEARAPLRTAVVRIRVVKPD